MKTTTRSFCIGLFLCIWTPQLNSQHPQWSEPLKLEARWPNGTCYAASLSGTYLYAGNGGALDAIDVSNPASPRRVGQIVLPSLVRDVEASGGLVFVATDKAGVRIIDVSSPENPTEVSSIATGGNPLSIRVQGTRVYVAADTAGVMILDVTDPANPYVLSLLAIEPFACDVALSNSLLLVATGDSTIAFFDVSDPAEPMAIAHYPLPGGFAAVSLDASDGLAYVASRSTSPALVWYGRLHVLDIHDPLNTIETGSLTLPGDWSSSGRHVLVRDTLAFVSYVSDVGNGLVIASTATPAAPKRIAQLHDEDAHSVCPHGSTLYVANGIHGVKIMDITTPESPSLIGVYGTADRSMDVVVSNQRAYLASATNGIRVLDLSTPIPRELGTYGGQQSTWGLVLDVEGSHAYVTSNYGWVDVFSVADPDSCISVARLNNAIGVGVKARDSLLFVADRNSGLCIADISNPAQPSWLSRVGVGGQIRDLTVTGSYVCVAVPDSGARIIDVANPRSPEVVATLRISCAGLGVAAEGACVYLSGADSALYIFNVVNPAAPVHCSSTRIGVKGRRVAVAGSYAYAATTEGVVAIDVSNPFVPHVLGFNPTGDSPQDIFATGHYLYVADNEDGLYVFRRTETSVTQPRSDGASSCFLEQNYPNPFNPVTNIRYTIGGVDGLSTFQTRVKLTVFDLLGREVAVLVDEKKDPGVYDVTFDGTDLSSGMYFYRLQAGAFVQTRRLLL
ncbi:MAG: T9SS type A sorting domain-containing protein, partial [Bacteroidetes bacterium]|nr:T9SS type A sorting domain-containing protein [Bacteroidota bacterium]